MTRFFARRLVHACFVLLGVSLLSFAFIELAPGEYTSEMRLNPQISPQTVAALRAEYGLDESLPFRYLSWLKSVFRGEMGFSFAYNSPVWPLIKGRAANTLILTLTALFCSWLVAIPAGVWGAARRGHWDDRMTGASMTLLLALPDVLIALGLLAFALWTGWFPTGGMHSLGYLREGRIERLEDLGLHMCLPLLALVAGTLPMLVRHVRAAMLDVLGAPFINAARGRGVPRRRLLLHHALPVAANPLLSLFGVSAGTLLSGSLLIEVIMSWPGVGPLLLQAILERDLYVVVAVVMFSTLFLVAGNLVADILLYVVDPRIRVE